MKRIYNQPMTKVSGLNIEVFLHQASFAKVRSNTVDYTGADEGMGVDNNASSVTMSSKYRGDDFYEGF